MLRAEHLWKIKRSACFLIPLLALLVMNSINIGIAGVFFWFIHYPQNFLLSYLLVFSIMNLLFFLHGRLYLAASCVLFGLFAMIGYIGRQKMLLKGTPLLPSDIYLVKEAVAVSGQFSYVYYVLAAIVILLILLTALVFVCVPKEKLDQWKPGQRKPDERKPARRDPALRTSGRGQRIIVTVISFAVLFVFFTFFHSIQRTFGLQMVNWSPKINYEQNGLLLCMMLGSEYLSVDEPQDYREENLRDFLGNGQRELQSKSEFQPNVIFVMSEAFWDPTVMENVTFSQDPLPFFHALQKSQAGGTMLCPVFGGGTANTELEVLTGFSTQFMPSGVVPYAQYIHKPIEALPAVLKRQGYTASALHTYDNWFYNRSSVYKNFGFDCFISKEFFHEPEYQGEYIRDTELTKAILKRVRETEPSDFIFAISMQNHGPYPNKENPENTIKAAYAGLSPDSLAQLNNYVNTLADVDRSLAELIEGLERIGEPTLVIFFGDHLPLLGEDYLVYKETGYIQGDGSYQDYLKLYTVPFVSWNNYGAAKGSYRISASFLGPLALEMAAKEGSLLMAFLSGLMKEGEAVVTRPDFIAMEKIEPSALNMYKLLQYDLLFRQEFVYRDNSLNRPTANDNFVNGSGPLLITGAEFSGTSVLIQGENFVDDCVVYFNEKAVKSELIDANHMKADLSEILGISVISEKADSRLKPKKLPEKIQWEIQLKLTDSQNKVISQSNLYSYRPKKGVSLHG